jgi:hypothetical protein
MDFTNKFRLKDIFQHVMGNESNRYLFRDIFGQAAYEALPPMARWLIDLIPAKEFREKIMPMMKIGNFAIPGLAVLIRRCINLPEAGQDYISALAAQIRDAINVRGKKDKSAAKENKNSTSGSTDKKLSA